MKPRKPSSGAEYGCFPNPAFQQSESIQEIQIGMLREALRLIAYSGDGCWQADIARDALAGTSILDGLKQAVAGDLARVKIVGHTIEIAPKE
jgi:hypothetical protein